MQNVFNEVFWEERWALQNYDYKFPVVGLVDYQRVLQRLADPEELYRGKRGSGFAVREQRRLASEAIPWPVVDKEGNKYALNPTQAFSNRRRLEWEALAANRRPIGMARIRSPNPPFRPRRYLPVFSQQACNHKSPSSSTF